MSNTETSLAQRVKPAMRRGAIQVKNGLGIFKAMAFSQPRISQMMFATISGVFLSIGTELLLRLLDSPSVGWKNQQSAGALFLIASILFSLLAWSAQGFLDYLIDRRKDRSTISEKTLQFSEWPERKVAQTMFGITVIVTAAAFSVLLQSGMN